MSLLRRLGPLGIALTVGQTAWGARRNWQAIPPERRLRLQELIRQSAGRPANLSSVERRELMDLMRELKLGELARETAMSAALPRRRFRRRW